MRHRSRLLLVLSLLAAGCLENEEEIVVRPDGSALVRMAAEGDVADLAEGYPVPLEGGWRATNAGARRWIARVGPATGGAEARRRVREEGALGSLQEELRLEVEREVARLAELPERTADPSDPYAEAYLRRSTSLAIEHRGPRTVYAFERTFHPPLLGAAVLERLMGFEDGDDQELWDAFQEGAPDSGRRVSRRLLAIHNDAAHLFLNEALLGHYVAGSARITPGAAEALHDRVVEGLGRLFSPEAVDALPRDEETLGAVWSTMYDAFRDLVREELAATAAEAELAPEERNALAFALERAFTAHDHATDISDEVFRLEVTLPGRVVTGDYDEHEGSTVRWEIDGTMLLQSDVTLRAVSVVE